MENKSNWSKKDNNNIGNSKDLRDPSLNDPDSRDSQSGDGDEIDLKEIYKKILRRKKIGILTACSILGATCIHSFHELAFNSTYQGSFTVLLTDPIKSGQQSKAGISPSPLGGMSFESLALNNIEQDLPSLFALLKSPILLKPVAEKHNISPGSLSSRISLAPGSSSLRRVNTGVMIVSVVGKDTKETYNILDSLSEHYLDVARSQRQQKLSSGIEFLEKQEPSLSSRTIKLQEALEEFRIKNNLIEPNREGVLIKGSLIQIENSIKDLNSRKNRLIKAREEIKEGLINTYGFEEIIILNSTSGEKFLAVNNPSKEIMVEFKELENEIAIAKLKFKPNSRILKSLESKKKAIIPLLKESQLEAADLAINITDEAIKDAEEQKEKVNKKYKVNPTLIKEYNRLIAKLEIAQKNLISLVVTKENFQLQMAQGNIPWRMLTPVSVSNKPISPNLPLNITYGAFLGLFVGTGIALIRDLSDNVFHHPGEIEPTLRLPLLGHIPYVTGFENVRESKQSIIEELKVLKEKESDSNETKKKKRYERFFYQEAFRNIYTSLKFINTEKKVETIALTSSLPSEGKSLTNVLLAKTISDMDLNVLLIDADLRKPQLHYRLGLNNIIGLSNILTDPQLSLDDVIQDVPQHSNWNIITAGTRPPDPTRLLSSQKMKAFVQEISQKKNYDLVIFDTPPILGLADAALIAEYCDGLILLVSLERVNRDLPAESIKRIAKSGVPLYGIISNSVSSDRVNSSNAYGAYGEAYSAYSYYASDEDANEEAQNNKNIDAKGTYNIFDKIKSNKKFRKLQKRVRDLIKWIDT